MTLPRPAWQKLPALLGTGALLLACALVPGQVRADDLQDASRLLKQGQQSQALDKVNQYLAAKPRDPQGRFLKGLILAEQNKTADAIDVFTKLTQDYPELPEPYNNLAVLYAAQGQYEKARQSLEMSIRTHPSYATAYENLGDVYAKLASQAYDKALQLDSSNTSAQTKLSLIRDLVPTNGSRVPRAAATPPATPPTAVAAAAPQTAPQAAAPKASPPAEAKAPAEPKPEPKPAPAAETRAAEAKPAAKPAEKPQAEAAGGESDEVLKAVRAWAAAWAAKDVKEYLAHYARSFKTPGGESRAEWEKTREQRIKAAKKIEVGVENPKVTVQGDSATVRFRQNYRSDHLKAGSPKTLVLARVDGKWLIEQERVGN
jgi:tetratricopeptide (TPR) repeat protein